MNFSVHTATIKKRYSHSYISVENITLLLSKRSACKIKTEMMSGEVLQTTSERK